MNGLKAFFITFFVSYLVIVLFFATYMLFAESFSWGWLGAGISVLFPALFYIKSYASPKPRTGRLWLVSSLVLFGFVVTLYPFIVNPGEIESTPVWLSACTYTLWILYIYWYSSFNRTTSKHLKQGHQLPEFQLETLEGKPVETSGFLGKKSLFMFYRGNWCPFCMAQIDEIVKHYQELNQKGVEVYIVSSQPEEFTRKLAVKHKVPVHFLIDPGNKAAGELGILHKKGTPAGLNVFGYHNDTAFPTVVICNEEGKVIFAHETNNYRFRPEPEMFLKVLDAYEQKG